MGASKKDSIVSSFLKSTKQSPVIAAIAAGLYPLLFYYSNNFTLINSWEQTLYFVSLFLVVPIIVFVVVTKLFKIESLKKWSYLVLPFLGVFTFLSLMKLSIYADIEQKITVGIILIAGAFAWFLWKHYKKVILFQLLLAAVGLLFFSGTLFKQLNFSDTWQTQPDDIVNVQFKKTPNVYLIQPDGYLNFSEISQGYYEIDNSAMESFLLKEGFVNYSNFRSNYGSTLSSNSSALMMKHHYYNNGTSFSEGLHARDIIISKNSVLDVFHKNGYITHFITEKPYLLANRPKMGYTKSNFSYDEIPYLTTGLDVVKDVREGLQTFMDKTGGKPSFYFVEIFNPGHISNSNLKAKRAEQEKALWIKSLQHSNKKLTEVITAIKEKDTNALIMIMADHGGYIGFESVEGTTTKTTDRNLIYSMFSAQLSILWPDAPPEFQNKLHSNINVFRILFSYLSDDKKYLDHLQDDSSYIIVKKGAEKGVYKYIDGQGEITFEKY